MTEWIEKPDYCGKWCVKHKNDDGPLGLVYDAEIRWDNGDPEVKIWIEESNRWHTLEWTILNGWSKWSAITKAPTNPLSYFSTS